MAINVDNALTPADNDAANDPASQGAGELRAVKGKLNSVFLSAGINADSAFLITLNNTGLYAKITGTTGDNTRIMYGFASNVTRTAAGNHTVGGQFDGICGPGISMVVGQTFGIACTAANDATSNTDLVGIEVDVGAAQANNVNTILGAYIVFKNRGDGAAAPTSGLGANKYNRNSTAILIDSQARGTTGEFCGWQNGIVFRANSMDNTTGGVKGSCLDASALNFDGGADPRFAYRVDSVIRMRTLQSILWDDLVSTKIRLYMNPANGRLVIANETGGVITERWGVDVGTGQVYKNGLLQY